MTDFEDSPFLNKKHKTYASSSNSTADPNITVINTDIHDVVWGENIGMYTLKI